MDQYRGLNKTSNLTFLTLLRDDLSDLTQYAIYNRRLKEFRVLKPHQNIWQGKGRLSSEVFCHFLRLSLVFIVSELVLA